MDITNEARKHLLNFLKKVLDGSYTQNESENFSILKYQNNDLEQIREEVSKIIEQIPGTSFSNKQFIGEDNRLLIEGLVCELEKQCT